MELYITLPVAWTIAVYRRTGASNSAFWLVTMWIRGDLELCPTIDVRLIRWAHSEFTLYDSYDGEGSVPVLSRTGRIIHQIGLGLSRSNPCRTNNILLVDLGPVVRRVDDSPTHSLALSLRIMLPLLRPFDLELYSEESKGLDDIAGGRGPKRSEDPMPQGYQQL